MEHTLLYCYTYVGSWEERFFVNRSFNDNDNKIDSNHQSSELESHAPPLGEPAIQNK